MEVILEDPYSDSGDQVIPGLFHGAADEEYTAETKVPDPSCYARWSCSWSRTQTRPMSGGANDPSKNHALWDTEELSIDVPPFTGHSGLTTESQGTRGHLPPSSFAAS